MAKSANDNMMTRPHWTDAGRPACIEKDRNTVTWRRRSVAQRGAVPARSPLNPPLKWPNFITFIPPHYVYRTAKNTSFKFDVQIEHKEYYQKCKLRSNSPKSHDLFLIFWDPVCIYGTGKVRDFKFGTSMQIDNEKYKQKCKSRS